MYNEKINEHYKNPRNVWEIDNYDIKYSERSNLCWDEMDVYLKIKDDKIYKFSFNWELSLITTASASILSQYIIWKDLDFILNIRYKDLENLLWINIHKRRQNAAMLWLLSVINAIKEYKQMKLFSFDDLL